MMLSIDAKKAVRVCDVCVKDQHDQSVAAKAAASGGAGEPQTIKKVGTMKPTGISALLVGGGAGGGHTRSASTVITDSTFIAPDEAGDSETPIATTNSSDEDALIPMYRHKLFTLTRAYRGDDRLMNAMELYLSEITYCKELEVLLSHFVTPLLKQISTGKKSLLSSQSHTQLLGKNVSPNLLIFLNSFQPLYTLALELHKCLHAKIITGEDASSTSAAHATTAQPQGWNPNTTTFGELFLRYAHLFDLYVEYSTTHKQALNILTDTNEIFYKEIFLKYEAAVRERMEEIQEEQRQMNELARKKEAEWTIVDDAARKAAAAAAGTAEPSPRVTPIEATEAIDGADRSAVQPPPARNRMSITRLSISSQPVVLDEPPPHTSLHDLLTTPFMRVSKYVWLLSSLLRATPEGHPDNLIIGPDSKQKQLATALTAVQQSLNNINTAILVGDNLTNLTKLQDKFAGSAKEVDLVAPNRHLLKEGMLLRQTRNGATNYYLSGNANTRHVISCFVYCVTSLVLNSFLLDRLLACLFLSCSHLFSDLLLYSELTVQGKYKIHRRLPLMTIQAVDTGKECALEIHSPIKSFVVVAATDEEKEAWLEEITLAVKAEEKRSAHAAATLSPTSAAASTAAIMQRESVMMAAAPLWAKDSTAEACSLCQKKFTFINRRHRQTTRQHTNTMAPLRSCILTSPHRSILCLFLFSLLLFLCAQIAVRVGVLPAVVVPLRRA